METKVEIFSFHNLFELCLLEEGGKYIISNCTFCSENRS